MLQNDSWGRLNDFFTRLKPIHFNKREVVLQADQPSPHVFYIKSGYMRAYRISEQGEELTLMILKSGDFFPFSWGDQEVLDNYYLEALTTSEVWRVPQSEFLKFIRSNPEVFYEFMSYAMVRLGGLLTRIEYLVFGNAYTKVATTLLICAKRFGDKLGSEIRVAIPLTHRDIATLVGITRETTCLEMKKLEKKGIISHLKRTLIVKDLGKLEEESMLNSEAETLLNNSL